MSRPRRQRLSRSRVLITDVLRENRKIPTCAQDRLVDLSQLQSLRAAAPTRISWPVLFLKAYALVCARHSLLRQAYTPWPWPHVYEHPQCVGVVAVHRKFRGEPWLFFPNFTAPENHSLSCLQRILDIYKTGDVEHVHRSQVNISGFPLPLRRLIWWWMTNVQPHRRARRMGTFSVTTLAGHNTVIQSPPSIQTTNITYGPMDEMGRSRVTLTYDHRMMDGLYVAEVLAELERSLYGPIADEMRQTHRLLEKNCCIPRAA